MEKDTEGDKVQEDDPVSNFEKELDMAKSILLNSLNSDVTSTTTSLESDTYSPHPSINQVVKLLAGKFDHVTLEQQKLNQKLHELKQRKEQYKTTMETLNQKLLAQMQENETLENTLRKKDDIIQNLEEERDRRDRIFDLCIQSNNGETREENEVTMNMSPGGHRTYEIKMKQKVPYIIKTERLSPKIWERYSVEHDNTDQETEAIESVSTEANEPEDISLTMDMDTEKEEEKYEEIQLSSSEDEIISFKKVKVNTSNFVGRDNNSNNNQNVKRRNRFNSHTSSEEEEQVQQQGKKEEKEEESGIVSHRKINTTDELEISFLLRKARERAGGGGQSISSSSSITQSTPTKSFKRTRSSSSSPEPQVQVKKGRSERSTTRNATPSSSTSFTHDKMSFPFDSLVSVSNVTIIPELYRINFDFSDCPIAQKFWYDEKYSKLTKFFIALHDDSDMDNQLFTLKEQKGLEFPQSFRLNFQDIATKLEATPKKRIFLDTRDFNFFSADIRSVLASIGDFVSHFSFGSHVYSDDKLRSNYLLDFVFQHLPNLEYLSVNDDMLCKLESRSDPEIMKNLDKLHTLRLVNYEMKFTTEFLKKVLKYTPNLKNLYGLPLSLLKDLMYEKLSVEVGKVIRSILTVSEDGSHGIKPKEVLDELSILAAGVKNNLEELDTRVSFIRRSSSRVRCLQKMTKIMDTNSSALKKLDLEAIGARTWLQFPILKHVTKLCFHLSPELEDVFPFFSKGSDLSRNFPNLSSVELILMHSSELQSTSSSRPVPLSKMLDKHFPPDIFRKSDTPFSNVTKLSLVRFCPIECMTRIATLFKNIRILHLQSTLVNVSHVLSKVFGHWQGLRQFVLDIDTNGNLDSAITGFDKDVCKTLRRNSSSSEPPSKEEAVKLMQLHRSRLSIFNLKDLHLFKIVLRSKGFHDSQPVISPFAVHCGFGHELMPNLTVQIAFDDRVTSKQKETMIKALSPVLPFITLER